MKYFSTLIKPASSLCNMRCQYCFYADVATHREIKSHGVMSDETMKILIDRAFNAFDEEVMMTFAFQGGEPTLVGLGYFKAFVQYVNEKKQPFHHVQYALQTNGLLINDDWIAFFKEHHFLIGVSLDGFIKNHDAVRPDAKLLGTYERVMLNVRKMQKEHIEFNVLTVLTSKLSKHAKELFEFYMKNELRYVQLIPCLPDFDRANDEYALKPREFFHFYDEFYQLWFKEWKKGNAFSVTLFDNLIPMLVGIPPQQCGALGFCSNQFVTESDGSVYPCDFYVLDQYQIGNIHKNSIQELATSQKVKTFLSEKRNRSKQCQTCHFEGICHGQCKRMSVCYYDETVCGLYEFLNKHEKTLIQVAKSIQ